VALMIFFYYIVRHKDLCSQQCEFTSGETWPVSYTFFFFVNLCCHLLSYLSVFFSSCDGHMQGTSFHLFIVRSTLGISVPCQSVNG
jgi:hypothetical protein